MNWLTWYGAVAGLALMLALVLTPLYRKLALRIGFLDIPACEKHKQHRNATPLLGGMAMFSAWILAFAAAGTGYLLFADKLPETFRNALEGIRLVKRDLIFLIVGLSASVLLGLADDRHAMKAGRKLIGQIVIAAVTAAWGGVGITVFLSNPALSFLLTVFWFVLIFNAINFFDNMDGLAAGEATIAFLFFFVCAAVNGQYFVALISALSAGTGLGFWYYNKSPAKLFMGDSGSHMLGFLLAYISAKVTYFTPGASTTKFNLLIPLFILAIPLLDTLTVVIIRIREHQPIYVGDHNHISHRFWHMGLSRANAVTMVHLLSIVAGLGALPLLRGDVMTSVILIIQGLVIYSLVCFLQYAVMKGSSDGSKAEIQKNCGQQSGCH